MSLITSDHMSFLEDVLLPSIVEFRSAWWYVSRTFILREWPEFDEHGSSETLEKMLVTKSSDIFNAALDTSLTL